MVGTIRQLVRSAHACRGGCYAQVGRWSGYQGKWSGDLHEIAATLFAVTIANGKVTETVPGEPYDGLHHLETELIPESQAMPCGRELGCAARMRPGRVADHALADRLDKGLKAAQSPAGQSSEAWELGLTRPV